MSIDDLEQLDPKLAAAARRAEAALAKNFWPRQADIEAETAKRAEEVERFELHEYARRCCEGAEGKAAQELARAFWAEHTTSLFSLQAFRKAALKVVQAERREAAERRREHGR